MSATPNNAGAGWNGSPPKTAPPGPALSGEGGQNALQALLAFACIRQQAERRRKGQASESPAQKTSEEQFALDEVLQLVAQRAVSITGADGVAVALADNDAIVCRAAAGPISPDAGIKLDPKSGFSGACLRSGETVRCDDSESDARVNPQACRALGARSMIAVPLAAKQRVIGLVEAFSSEPHGFNESDERSLNLLGELILAAIRPEEEDRLAEIAKRVVGADVAPEKIESSPVVMSTASTPAPASDQGPQLPTESLPAMRSARETVENAPPASNTKPESQVVSGPLAAAINVPRRTRIIVDEKFSPVRDIPAKPKPQPDESVSKVDTAPKLLPLASETEDEPLFALRAAEPAVVPKPAIGRRSWKGIGLIAALVLVVIGMAVAIWTTIRHGEQEISANTQRSVEVKTAEGEVREIIATAPAVETPGPATQVTGLRKSSSGDSSAVVIDLQDQVQYEEHTLDNPARVYVDLHDTRIAPEVANKVIEVDDSLLKRVRMAQSVEGVTRVVLEMKDGAQFSGVRLDSNPYRLTIEVHKGTPTLLAKATPTALPKPSPSISVSPKKTAELRPASSEQFQVVLDAGHGGWDLGTVGKKGLLEKDLVLDIVERLGRLLQTKMGAQVIYTRQDDSYLALEKRAEIANVAGADLFLSVHANYSDLSTARGVETYFTNSYSSIKARTAEDEALLKQINWTNVDIRAKVTDSRKLAGDVQQALCSSLVAMNPELRNRGVKEAQYVVLTGTQMPAALAEVSFVSSPEEEEHLQTSEYRQRIALALYRGVEKYREESKSKNTKLASAKKPDAKKSKVLDSGSVN